jgi:hypothetical protein
MDIWRNLETHQTARHEALLAEARSARLVGTAGKASWLPRFIGITLILLGMMAWLAH